MKMTTVLLTIILLICKLSDGFIIDHAGMWKERKKAPKSLNIRPFYTVIEISLINYAIF